MAKPPVVVQQASTVHRVALARDYYERLFGVAPRVFIRKGLWRADENDDGVDTFEPSRWLRVEPRTWGFILLQNGPLGIRRANQSPFQFKLEV